MTPEFSIRQFLPPPAAKYNKFIANNQASLEKHAKEFNLDANKRKVGAYIFRHNNMLIDNIFFNSFTGNIHFSASRDIKSYIEKILFLQKAVQRGRGNDKTFFYHDDTSPYLRRIDEILQAARSKGLIIKHFVNSSGVSFEFPGEGNGGKPKLVKVVEPFAQLLIFIQDSAIHLDGISYSKDVWDKLKISESSRKPDGKKEIKYFNYTTKNYVYQNKPPSNRKRSNDGSGKGSGPNKRIK